MNTISPRQINRQLNNCYESYDPNWAMNIGKSNIMNGFKYHLEQSAGLKLDYEVETKGGKMGYKINSIVIVDDPAFTMWMLRWS
jgi:hypothetical protein